MAANSNVYCDGDDCLRVMPFASSREQWEAFLSGLPSATLYHQYSWLHVLRRAYGFSLHLATLEKGDRTIAACVLARTRYPLNRRFVALPFSDGCPPLALDDHTATRMLNLLANRAMPEATFEIRGIRGSDRWSTNERFVNWIWNLEDGQQAVERGLSINFRRNLRRARYENITVSRETSQEALWRYYRLHLITRRRLGIPAQPWRFFKLLGETFRAQNSMEIWLARRASKDVAGVVLLKCGETLHYKWSARDPADGSRANHLVIWNIVEEHSAQTHAIDLGRTDICNPGLMRFKKGLGATSVPLPYCYYPRTPVHVSPEVLVGTRKSIAAIWSALPVSATRILSRVVYPYFG